MMRFRRVLILMVACLAIFGVTNSRAQSFSINESPLPPPTSPVMDYAGVLDESAKTRIAQRIIEFRKTSNPKVELAVAVVKTTGERPIFDYSMAVARGWKIGSREDDNPGALLFIAVEDRKYFTQVSKDLEDELPDGVVGQLQRRFLVPAFRQKDYASGISDTIEAYIATIEGKRDPNAAKTAKSEPEGSFGAVCGFILCLMIIVFILFIIFSASSKSGSGKGGKGDGNWRGGGFGGGTGSSAAWWIPIILGSGSSGSSSSSSWGGSSGWSGGGSSGGWGGFGGGGDFGGGGSGGSW